MFNTSIKRKFLAYFVMSLIFNHPISHAMESSYKNDYNTKKSLNFVIKNY